MPTLASAYPSDIAVRRGARLQGVTFSVPALADLKALTSRPEVVIVETGQAKGVWQWEAGSSTTADDALVVNPTSGTAGRYKRVYDGAIYPDWFGAAGDGVTNDTAAIQAFFTASYGLIAEVTEGTYLIDDINISGVVDVRCHPNAIFKKRTGSATSSRLIEFVSGSEGSTWRGGQIDGNRSALSGSWTTAGGVFDGWFGMVSEVADVIVSGVTFRNWVDRPFWFAGDYNKITHIRVEDCGCAATFGYRWFGAGHYTTRPTGNGALGQYVEDILTLRTDNDGVVGVFQHAIDLFAPKAGAYKTLAVIAQGGDTDGGSAWASGITAENCEDCDFDGWNYEDPTTDVLEHLAFSLLGCIRSPLKSPRAFNLAGQALEMNDCVDCPVINPTLDGNYRATTAVPAGDSGSLGITYYIGSWNPNRATKSLGSSERCDILGGTIKRFTYGGIIRCKSSSLIGVNVIGNISDGLVLQEAVLATYFAGAAARHGTYTLSGCNIQYNGRSGVEATSFDLLSITGSRINNNGQDSALATNTRAGVRATTGDRLSITATDMSDSQTWTVADMVSFEPQTSDADDVVVVYPNQTDRLHIGQYVTLTNATGAGDVTGKVIDIDRQDGVHIQCSAPTTLADTGNTTALSGTWTGSGTTLTGSGGAATTEILGPTWVTDGTEWRRVLSAASSNALVINAAFTTALSADTLTKLSVDATGIPSQQEGLRIFGTTDQIMLKGNTYEGNVLSRMVLSDVSNCITGCEFYRTATVTTDAATENLLTAIGRDHVLLGVAARVDSDISGGGASSWSLLFTDSGGSTITSISTLIALTKNTKVSGSVVSSTKLADGNLLRATFAGGTPTAGAISVEALFRVDAPAALASLP